MSVGRVAASRPRTNVPDNSTPRPGERTLWRWSSSQVERVAPEALARADATTSQIAAVGIANQRETTVLRDRLTGVPIGRAIVWQDMRTGALVDELNRAPGAAVVTERSGLPIVTYFSAPRVRRLLDHTPGLRARAERGEVLFGTMESWLIWNLSGGVDGGVHVTERTFDWIRAGEDPAARP
ncbi:FGGY family carbohydrate kinase [Actinomadura syzygii]|uniref:FGGY family carbohydrate kinase n=1 Tax=Actinomadura syzygii TaxID=1427538 RepID=UPI001FE75D1F|nr:FGGY family carbohydrate kinase [Actinomadura syzygii]